jgi:bifunctional NMN adenylyltransferase/nudix hydrolase
MEYHDEKIELNIPPVVDVNDYEIGVIICRMQVPELHPVHKKLIDTVCSNHKKVILFLGVPVVEQTKRNPLDFASRKAMIQKNYPEIAIIPIRDQRENETWSYMLDSKMAEPFGNRKFLLYGGRDSFIPYYRGRHQTVELVGNDIDTSGTAIRNEVSREVVDSTDFRKGVIYANYGRYPVIMPCADIVVYDPSTDSILLGRKPQENLFRFIGGHVEVTDSCYEAAAIKELGEEAPGISICETTSTLRYICSGRIQDWRHAKENSEIFSTLFMATKMSGSARAADDIEEVKWFKVDDIKDYERHAKMIVPEHLEFFGKLVRVLEEDRAKRIAGTMPVEHD